MTKLLLSIHVLVAIIAIGPVTVAASMFPAATRRALAEPSDPRGAAVLHNLHRICRVYATLGVLVPVFGLATASSLGVLGDAWLIISIFLTAAAAAVLVFLVLPGQATVLRSVPISPPSSAPVPLPASPPAPAPVSPPASAPLSPLASAPLSPLASAPVFPQNTSPASAPVFVGGGAAQSPGAVAGEVAAQSPGAAAGEAATPSPGGAAAQPSGGAASEAATPSPGGVAGGRVAARLGMVTGVFNLLWAVVVVLMIVRPGSTTGA